MQRNIPSTLFASACAPLLNVDERVQHVFKRRDANGPFISFFLAVMGSWYLLGLRYEELLKYPVVGVGLFVVLGVITLYRKSKREYQKANTAYVLTDQRLLKIEIVPNDWDNSPPTIQYSQSIDLDQAQVVKVPIFGRLEISTESRKWRIGRGEIEECDLLERVLKSDRTKMISNRTASAREE